MDLIKHGIVEPYAVEGSKIYDIQVMGLSCFKKCLFPTLRKSWGLSHNPAIKIADLACGTGNFTRPLKKMSGGTVVGIDLSNDMLNIARKKEEAEPLGIKYIMADCSKDMLKIPEIAAAAPFDMINVAWLVEYANDMPTLKGMIQNMYNLLKPGGVVCSLAENTSLTWEECILHQRYGMRFPGITDPAREGVYDYKEKKDGAYSIAIYVEDPKVKPYEVGYYSWTLETVQSVYKEVGFSKYELITTLICEADTEYEAEYYKPYCKLPDMVISKATK